MSAAAFTVVVMNFALIGSLPRVFFEKGGRLNLRWWLTALPFFTAFAATVISFAGVNTWLAPRLWRHGAIETAGVALATASVGFIMLTLGTHRRPVALWHQDDDAPRHLVMHGAYARVRHPFYSAFLLALAGAFLASAQPMALAAAAYGFVALNVTAAREERRLASSELGAAYRAYMARTGRFLPRPRRAVGVPDIPATEERA